MSNVLIALFTEHMSIMSRARRFAHHHGRALGDVSIDENAFRPDS